MKRDRVIAIAVTLISLFFISLGTVISKFALQSIQPLTLTWTTVAVGLICMVVYTFIIKKERVPKLNKRIWIYIISIGFFNFFIGKFTQIYALDYLSAITSTFIFSFVGVLTMWLSVYILKEPPTIFQFIGVTISIIGLKMYYMQIPAIEEMFGVVLTLLGITGIAFTNNITRKLAIITDNSLSNNIVSTLSLIIGGSMTVTLGLVLDWPPRISGITNWSIIVYVGVVTIAVGLTIWNKALRVLRSYEASILGTSGIVWTGLLAIAFLGESISIIQIIGIALMIIGLLLVQIRTVNLNLITLKVKKTIEDLRIMILR